MIPLMLRGYLLGSVPFAYLFARLFGGVDIRRVGSFNVGTTNVVKRIGLLPGILTALGDAGKGLIAVWLGELAHLPGGEYLSLLAAMVGHNWPVWLRFHGGGGLATFIGGSLLLTDWWMIGILLLLWVLLYLLLHDHCKSAIAACALAPILLGLHHHSWTYFAFGQAAGFIIGIKQVKALIDRRKNHDMLRKESLA